ncbi:MAG: isoprenylcysteine carboxylmethyltransferase family protein [Patescibacteria group bacterium]|nr:isoprenylcysteine carboxylmethyltransferase family protein [Patescibacteria group bacterium]
MKHTFWAGPYIMWAVIGIGVVINFVLLPHAFMYESSTTSFLLFALAFLYWVYFFTSAATKNLQAPHRPEHITQIITTGTYHLVRHPMYSADIVLMWGISVAYPLVALWASALWLTLVMVLWSYWEEQILLRRFGETYDTYKKKTPMFLPFKKHK